MNAQPRYISTETGRIEYFMFGHGKPIVLISGYAANVSAWNRKFLFELAKRNQLIIFNNRNVDGSYNKSAAYSAKDLANDTYSLITQLHLHKPAVVGISMGGMIAQQLAVLHSNAIGHLVLINTAIAGTQAVKPSLQVQALLTNIPQGKIRRFFTVLRLMAPPFWWPRVIYTMKTDRFIPMGHKELGVSKKTLPQQQQLVLAWSKDEDAARKIATLHVPTLILNGEKDMLIPPVNSMILADTIPQAKIKRWPNGGHMMAYQFPESIANAIVDFVNQ
ncbi:alpha/beta fold hydrolase [Legionella massiliensis]|nr:alpha/beta hydrolase [Legionella massiliensis]